MIPAGASRPGSPLRSSGQRGSGSDATAPTARDAHEARNVTLCWIDQIEPYSSVSFIHTNPFFNQVYLFPGIDMSIPGNVVAGR